MHSIFKGSLAAAAVSLVAAAPALANVVVPLAPHTGWTEFQFQGDGSMFQDYSANTIDFTFTLTKPNIFQVTDGWNDGDQFDVIINSIDVGPTSTPKTDFLDVDNRYSQAIGKYAASFSHAIYLLGAGSYDIEGYVLKSVYGAGTGAVALGVVPEPSTWAMLIAGVGLVGGAARRKRAVHTA